MEQRMLSLLFRVLFNAIVLMFILPAMTSITFTGEFWPEAIVAGLLFAIVAHIIGWLTKVFIFGTLGLGMIVLFFFWWMIPAIQLMVMASWFPQYLSIPGWGSAIFGGIVFMIVNSLVHYYTKNEKKG